MSNFVKDGMNEHVEPVTTPLGYIDIVPEFILALSHLWGWDELRDQWRQIGVDSNGRLLVSTSPTKGDTANHSIVTADITGLAVLANNPNRTQVIIQNVGANNVYINFGEAVNTAVDMLLAPNISFFDNIFTGPVFAKTTVGTSDLRVVEMT